MIRLSSKQILWLLILCGAVILHATMWPYNFRFDWGSVPASLHSAIDLPFTSGWRADKKDIVRNVILFLPFGALLFLHRAKGIAASRSVLSPTVLCMLFSVSIETTQCFLPTRTGSLVDVCSNTLGALLGAVAARTSLRVAEQTPEEEARRAFRRNALFLSLAAYSFVLVASSVYTLDPVRSLPELAVRGKAFLRSSWVGDATLAKAAGPILYQYQDVDFGNASYDWGVSATVGVEWYGGNTTWGLQYSYNTASIYNSMAILVTTGPVPVSVQSFAAE